MFFIGIFGTDTKTKLILESNGSVCPHCNTLTHMRFCKLYNYFHFFFIPLFRWGAVYYILSDTCGHQIPIETADGKSLENGILSAEELLKKLNINNQSVNEYFDTGESQPQKKCPICGRINPDDFKFCPECGQRI